MPPLAVELVDDILVDISHESLIRQWETLRGWVEAEGEAGKVYRRLAEDAERYAAGKGSLLVGRALEVACEWCRETQPSETLRRVLRRCHGLPRRERTARPAPGSPGTGVQGHPDGALPPRLGTKHLLGPAMARGA